MKRTFQAMVIPVVAVLSTASIAAPVQAAPMSSTISFNVDPEPIEAGSYVTLSGTAGAGNTGNAGIVRLLFRSYHGSSYTQIATTTAAATGRFSARIKQHTSGYWKAVYNGNAARPSVTSAVDYVEAKAWRNVASTRFSRSGAGDYRSAPTTWYTDRVAKVSVTVNCSNLQSNFLSVTWNGHPDGFDYAWFDIPGTSFSGSSFMYPDQKNAHIEVMSQIGCSWNVSMIQLVRTHATV